MKIKLCKKFHGLASVNSFQIYEVAARLLKISEDFSNNNNFACQEEKKVFVLKSALVWDEQNLSISLSNYISHVN